MCALHAAWLPGMDLLLRPPIGSRNLTLACSMSHRRSVVQLRALTFILVLRLVSRIYWVEECSSFDTERSRILSHIY